MQGEWNDKIFSVNKENFESLALEIFRFQYDNNPVYKNYTDALGINPATVKSIAQIPFLPIRFFKSHTVQTTSFSPQAIFESSGTTGSINSRHFVKDLSLYEESFTKTLEFFYGSINSYCIIGLLPSYLERENSSLVYMVEKLIQLSKHPQSSFYLNENEKLVTVLHELESQQQKTLLIGVTFALLDFAEQFSPGSYRENLKFTVLIETGGMKGRRKEMIRPQVHDILKQSFRLPFIHSEYGMTELLSQAYSKGEGIFHYPPWMKVLVRDDEDPLELRKPDFQSMAYIGGAINIIDLANIYSCSFIATDDLGKIYDDGSFEVLGRIDNSDLRGCSLLSV
jgi:phenylacetate-coenzyme A ligase PaaK-like adenylate-forming protein